MIKYLSSGVIKGVGPAVAKKIVEAFGDDTFSIIEKTPHRLSEIKGITAKKADSIADEFKEIFGVRCLMSFLSSQGINAVQSVSIFKRWGVMALDLIKQNPYILIKENVDFALADNIAKNLSIPLDSPLRICAGLEFVLMHNSNNGFTCLPKDKLIITVCKLLGLETDLINTSLEQMLFESRLYSYNTSIPLIYLPCFYLAQKYICSRLQIMINVYSNQDVDADDTIALIEENKNINYEGLQKKAINQAVKQNVFILTGGPGTGKTTTLNAIIEILEQQGKKVSIAAPTGRAAKRISEVTGKEAKTIHRLLEVEMGYAKTNKLEFVHNEQNPLECDVVIIDEMSMIDTLLFESLLRGMKPSAKLIMVGDF
ncbi:MAG: ATPase, T2SS/T4P/T4SS family, partial [Oscillospiraceae bacterium]